MIELVIGTASGALSVALIDGDRLVAEHHEVIGRGHAETIVSVVAAVIGQGGAPSGDSIGGIVVDIGPGSFTGVRIGVAAARALGLAWGVPVAGVGSLALLAAAAFAESTATTVAATTDAGRGRLYWQCFSRDACRPLGPPAVGEGSAIIFPEDAAVVGTMAKLSAGETRHPRAAAARLLPRDARTAPLPLYLAAA